MTKTLTRYGKRISDAKGDITIRVKAADIKGAVCRDHQKCVIARAILRQRASTAKWVDVGNAVVLIGTGEKTGKRYRLSGQAKEQVRFFDTHDGRFAPCTVTLSAPGTHRPIGARKGKRDSGSNKRSGKRTQPTR